VDDHLPQSLITESGISGTHTFADVVSWREAGLDALSLGSRRRRRAWVARRAPSACGDRRVAGRPPLSLPCPSGAARRSLLGSGSGDRYV